MLAATLDLLERNLKLYRAEDDCWIVHNVSAGMAPMGPSPVQSSKATIMIATNLSISRVGKNITMKVVTP